MCSQIDFNVYINCTFAFTGIRPGLYLYIFGIWYLFIICYNYFNSYKLHLYIEEIDALPYLHIIHNKIYTLCTMSRLLAVYNINYLRMYLKHILSMHNYWHTAFSNWRCIYYAIMGTPNNESIKQRIIM